MNYIQFIACISLLFAFSCSSGEKTEPDSPIEPVGINDVMFKDDSFWGNRIKTNCDVTIAHNYQQMDEHGYYTNFRIAAGLEEGEYPGTLHGYADSEVYKYIEGVSYCMMDREIPGMENQLDSLIELIGAAQWDNGHLHTRDAALGIEFNPENMGTNHRMYNPGHMYEGAVAHYLATGKRNFLDIAIKNADMMVSLFGEDNIRGITPGHEEIEVGLMKLYQVTGNEEYLNLALFLLEERGTERDKDPHKLERQKHKPVAEQSEAVGHAVRAGYLYMGMADVAMEKNHQPYMDALDRIWNNVVGKKLYITGGIGSFHKRMRENGELGNWEGFGENYELPNDSYCESCAAIANALWNYRMFQLHGDAQYIDVLERIIYNNGLSMVSVEGNRFFYQNNLISPASGNVVRGPWKGCCTNNILRFIPQVQQFIYATKGDVLYINLFTENQADIELASNTIHIKQETDYPWKGEVKIMVTPVKSGKFTVNLRIPGWAHNTPVPSDLYKYHDKMQASPVIKVNDELLIQKDTQKGFIQLDRKWHQGDVIHISLPMNIKRVIAHEKVEANQNKVALECGPLVYCAEWPVNPSVHDLVIPDDADLKPVFRENMLHGIATIEGEVTDTSGNFRNLVAIPYYTWAHRGEGDMTVWFNRNKTSKNK
jgi:uncharacterized protein